jgi:hypothetical protein
MSNRRVQGSRASISLVVALGLGCFALTSTPSSAFSPTPGALLVDQQAMSGHVIEVRAVVRRGGVAVGPRGNAVAYRSKTVVRGPVARPGYAGWARPSWYRWPAGGAIAAGAALGFVAAGAAVAYAGAAPAPGMCWYYTDPSRTQGFWDTCP